MNVAPMPRPMLASLQIGRALAALAVVVNHAVISTHTLYPSMPVLAQQMAALGHLGVDYFFVLSGFIIAHVTRGTQASTANARRYALSRITRIYVPYLPIGLVMFAAFTLHPALSMGARGEESLWASLLLPSSTRPALWAGWTLQHELVFYSLFGLSLFLLKNPRWIFLWALPIVLACGMEYARLFHILIGPIDLEFLFGVAACELYHARRFARFRNVFVMLGAALVLLVAVRTLLQLGSPREHLLAGVGFAFLVLGAVQLEARVRFARLRVLTFLGSASYAIYLLHGPVNSLLMRVLPANMGWQATALAMVLLSTSAGIAYFWWVERPLMRFARPRSR